MPELFTLQVRDRTGAEFSPCRRYRYTLWRRWDDGPLISFIGLNPSTADEIHNDPTVTRCIRFAGREGAGGMAMLNLFAFRATDPKIMKAQADPVGPENDLTIATWVKQSEIVVCCWGSHGRHMERSKALLEQLRQCGADNLHHLGLTKTGEPKHPLYLRADTPLQPFDIQIEQQKTCPETSASP